MADQPTDPSQAHDDVHAYPQLSVPDRNHYAEIQWTRDQVGYNDQSDARGTPSGVNISRAPEKPGRS